MGNWSDVLGAVRLPDGRTVRGTGLRRPRGTAPDPEFAVYLLSRDPHVAAWPSRWVRWGDFRLPRHPEDALDALREAHRRAALHRVEIVCGGGVGRTSPSWRG